MAIISLLFELAHNVVTLSNEHRPEQCCIYFFFSFTHPELFKPTPVIKSCLWIQVAAFAAWVRAKRTMNDN